MKRYFPLAGLDSEDKRLSLRSLRATVATRLNQEGVDDNVIMQRTGHRSQAGLDRYKRPGLKKNVVNVSKRLTLSQLSRFNPMYLLYLAAVGFSVVGTMLVVLVYHFNNLSTLL